MRRMRPVLGTYVEIVLTEGTRTDAVFAAAFAVLEQVQGLMSFQDPRSELSRLNGARGSAVRLHPWTRRALALACAMCRASGGGFNPTVGGALVRRGVLPDHAGGDVLEHGGPDDVEFAGAEVRLRRPVRITLDGLAKGYAVDLAVRSLLAAGALGGWVNAGGDLRAFGSAVVPVHRREQDGRIEPLGGLHEAALATSRAAGAVEERFPAHVVAGGPGLVVEEGVWSVLARRAWRADALTKVACSAPPHRRDELIGGLGGRCVTPGRRGGS